MSKQCSYLDVVVNTEWVADHQEDQTLVIAEVDQDPQATYARGHIPGAIGWELHIHFEEQIRRDIPGPIQLESLLERAGIHNNSTVVLYGDGNNRSATWAFWILKYYGHEDVRIMNGGRQKWLAEKRPLSTNVPKPTSTSYKTSDPNPLIRATKEYLLANLNNRAIRLLDTRTHEENIGLLASAPGTPQSGIYRKGRIPNSVHVPWDDSSTVEGTFKPIEDLRKMYTSKGINPSQETIPYCRLGVRASYTWFVLKYLLGFPRVRNYDGSWTEWGNAVGVPIETGPTGPIS